MMVYLKKEMEMRKYIQTILFPVSLVAVLAGCSKEITGPQPENPAGVSSTKIINTPADAQKGSMLVFLDEDAAACAMTGAVPEGIDSLLTALDAVSFERLIPYRADDEEKLKKYGLDRWYEVKYDSDIETEYAASLLSRAGAVSRVQYNTKMKKASDLKSYSYVTRSSVDGLPFNDPSLADQWHYYNPGDMALCTSVRAGADVNVKDAWSLCAGDPRVIVAVLDEGVQYTHPDLAANMWTNQSEVLGSDVDNDGNGYSGDVHGFNFVTNTGNITWNNPGDSGHGTHVAGTIAAVNNNGTGVCGIAGGSGNNDGVKIMSCQIFDGNDGGTSAHSSAAIIYAARNGASIIQCSFGSLAGTVTNDGAYEAREEGVEAAALNYFLDNAVSCDALDGGIAIFASGNESTAMAAYPGAYKRLVSVTAIACDNLPANYTNYGYGCDIAAPGGEYYTGSTYSEATCILSTMPTEPIESVDSNGEPTGTFSVANYGYMQGTSMACPHVSGVAALGLSYALKTGKHYTQDEFMSILLTSVNDIDHLLAGSKRTMYNGSMGQMPLSPLKGKMGSGTIDAWRLLMQIEGTPCLSVKNGESQSVSLSQFFGGGADVLLLENATVEISADAMNALGLMERPVIRYGQLQIYPTRIGSGKITVTALVGGDSENSDSTPSGERISREISIISRNAAPENGGWL